MQMESIAQDFEKKEIKKQKAMDRVEDGEKQIYIDVAPDCGTGLWHLNVAQLPTLLFVCTTTGSM